MTVGLTKSEISDNLERATLGVQSGKLTLDELVEAADELMLAYGSCLMNIADKAMTREELFLARTKCEPSFGLIRNNISRRIEELNKDGKAPNEYGP